MHLSIITAESLQLEALLETLGELDAAPKVDLVAVNHDSQSALYAGRSLAFEILEDYDFTQCDAALLLTDTVAVEAAVPFLQKSNCKVFAWAASADILSGIDASRITFIANPFVQALGQVFSALPNELVVEHAVMTGFLPSSIYAKEGVADLAAQTAKLLNAQAVEEGVFETQMTFNYFPAVANGIGASFEKNLKRELQALFADAQVRLSTVQMPIFHGYGAQVFVELSQELSAAEFSGKLQGAEFIELVESGSSVSGLSFANAGSHVLLGNISQDKADLHSMSFWLGFDEAKFGVANNWISAIMNP
ncbi:MAG: hypothetical protein KAG18_08475 [Sinobacterium sp.]|nr:hypothetical protein [Sinobacterium sp.]